MTDSQYKNKSLVGLDPTSPAIGNLRRNSALRWAPFAGLLRAQDTVPATSRRVVASWSLGGAQDWAQPTGTADPGVGAPVAHVYPTDTVWRTLGIHRAHVTPGCELWAHLIYCPAGLTQFDAGGGVNFASAGAWAEFRVRATWTNGGSTDGPNDHSVAMEGSTLGTYGGREASGAGQNWTSLRRKKITAIRPADYLVDPAEAVAFSEWSDVELELQVRGGSRLVAVVVYEMPRAHVTLHSNAGLTSVHAMPGGNAPLTPLPMTKAPDGVTYEEHRFGTLRMAQVAERQSDRLGLRPFSFSTWDESTVNVVTATENAPIAVTSASFVDLMNSAITTYSDDNPGWLIAGSNAQLHRLCDPTLIAAGRFAVIPVRVHVEATPAAAGTAVVRVQSGPWEYVDVTITGGGARAWFSAVGFLRSQVFADHNQATAQIFARTSSGTLNVRNVSVDFGHWA